MLCEIGEGNARSLNSMTWVMSRGDRAAGAKRAQFREREGREGEKRKHLSRTFLRGGEGAVAVGRPFTCSWSHASELFSGNERIRVRRHTPARNGA
jgi:hypothetical protein